MSTAKAKQVYASPLQIASRFGISKSTLARWRKRDPTFPQSSITPGGQPSFVIYECDEWYARLPKGNGRVPIEAVEASWNAHQAAKVIDEMRAARRAQRSTRRAAA